MAEPTEFFHGCPVRRSARRRRVAAAVTPDGRVELRVPAKAGAALLEAAWRTLRPWIARKLAELEQRPEERSVHFEFAPGARFFYCGKAFPLVWREAAAVEPAVRFTGECFLTATRDPAAIRRGLETFYRDETRRLTAAMLASHAPRVGVTYGRVAVTGARRRFGSCGRTGNLNFSWRLALYPEPLIELVVLHELVHRVEMNHSPAFYKVLSRHLPDHRERRRALLEWSRKLCLYPE